MSKKTEIQPSSPNVAFRTKKANDLDTKKRLIETSEDYIDSGRYDFSIAKFLDSHPNGTKDSIICRLLIIDQNSLNEMYEAALKKLKAMLKD
jgi:hypothetical protein